MKASFVRALLPAGVGSFSKSVSISIRDFGIINTIKIFFHVFIRIVRYKIKLSLLPKGRFIKKDIFGRSMMLDKEAGGVSWDLLVNGVREKKSTLFFREEIQKGMSVLEIGANIGYYLIQEVGLVGTEGSIYAFEPDPKNIDLLKKNIALQNDSEIVHLQEIALGNMNGNTDFYSAERGNLSGVAVKQGKKIQVPVRKADALFPDKKIDYVRMDVEGYEFEIIKGMERLIRSSIKGLFIELHPLYLSDLGTSMREFIQWLNNRHIVLVKAYSDYEWNNYEFDRAETLLNCEYVEKMVWRCFFRKVQ